MGMSASRGEDFKSKRTENTKGTLGRAGRAFGVARPGLEPGTN